MGQGLTNQIENSVPDAMAAVYNRHPERAFHVYRYSGRDRWPRERSRRWTRRCATAVRWRRGPDDHLPLAEIDVVIDVTGLVEFAPRSSSRPSPTGSRWC